MLRLVGVLVLVDQDVAETFYIALAHVGVVVEEEVGVEQQVVEVHGLGCAEALLVDVVDASHLPQPVHVVAARNGSIGAVSRRQQQVVLGLGDAGRHDVGLILLVVEPEFAHNEFEE